MSTYFCLSKAVAYILLKQQTAKDNSEIAHGNINFST